MRNMFLFAVAALSLAGCASTTTGYLAPTYETAASNPFRSANYAAADSLMKGYGGPVSASNSAESIAGAPFVIATLVNIDQLDQSSTLGRTISEQVSSRLTQTGHGVIDLKVRNSVYMRKSEGEFLLSREIKEAAINHRAQAVIVGTYALSATYAHITLKLVDPSSSRVLSAYDYSLPLDSEVKSMLRKNAT